MIPVHMVEVTFHQIVGVVAVRNRLVSAIGPMFVALLVPAAIVVRGTRCRVLPAYADFMLVKMVTVGMV
jgi:hypothetical protein